MKNKINFSSDFYSADKKRISSFHILNDEGKAIWLCDIVDGEVERVSAIKSLFEKKDEFVEICHKLIKQKG